MTVGNAFKSKQKQKNKTNSKKEYRTAKGIMGQCHWVKEMGINNVII